MNNDIKEAADTFDHLWQLILSVWGSFPLELKAFVLAMFVISILMQWIKKALLADMPKKERIRALWLYSLPLGVLLAGAGRFTSGTAISDVYWLVIGLTVGAGAMGVHFVSTNVVWPGLKTITAAVWSRVLLVAKGTPRSD